MSPRQARALMLVALPLVTLAAYASALGNGFVWDDHAVIEKGGLIGSLSNIPALYAHDAMWNSDGGDFSRRATIDTYRPLTLTTFAFERALFGLRPLGFHLVSVLLHAGNALLLLALGLRLGLRPAAALAGATLFALHPSISEAVHWINGRSDPLAVACFLGALLVWWPWLEGLQSRSRPSLARPLAVAALALLGSLAKETMFLLAAALPLVLLLRRSSDPAAPSPDRMSWSRAALAFAPWAAGLAAGFALRLAALGRPAVSGGGYHLAHALPRLPLIWADALTSLVAPAPRLVPSLHQAYLTVGPGRMVAALAVVVLALAAAAAVAVKLPGRQRLLWPWALSTLLLVLAPIAMLTHSEGWSGWGRYLYPASPLFALAVAALLLEELLPRARPAARKLLAGLGGLALVACAAQTFLAGQVWRDDETLARAWIEEAPGSAPGYLALGLVHYERGQPEHALPLFAAAVARAPRNAEMQAKLGLAQSALGQRAASWQSAQRVLALEPQNRLGRYLVVLGLLSQRREVDAANVLVPLMAEDPDEGLWNTMREAWQRTGPGSAFRSRVQALVSDSRYRRVGEQLPTRVADH